MNDRMDLADVYRTLSANGFVYRPQHNDWYRAKDKGCVSDETLPQLVRDWPLLVPAALDTLDKHGQVGLERLATLHGLAGVQVVLGPPR